MSDVLLERVKRVVLESLALDLEYQALGASSQLIGAIPELDSLGILELAEALEGVFSITFEDGDLSESNFESLGALVEFVRSKQASR